MKKIYKIIIIVLALLLIGGAYFIYASFNGSIVKKAIVTHKAKDYLAQNYDEGEFSIKKARYNFKDGRYYCHVQSNKSIDTNFAIFEDRDGKMKDDFEDRVTGGLNTFGRLSAEMNDFMDKEMERIYPHKLELCLCSFYEKDEDAMSALTIDMPLDLKNPVHPLSLTLWVQSEGEPTWQELAEKLREAVEIMDNEGYDISYYSMSLYYPQKSDDEKPSSRIANINAFDVPKSVILSDDLPDYLENVRIEQEKELEEIRKGNAVKK